MGSDVSTHRHLRDFARRIPWQPIAAVALCLSFGAACADEHRPPLSPEHVRLDQPRSAPLPTTALAPVALTTQADFDALERSILTRRRPDVLIDAYTALAEGAEPAERDADALLLQRLAILLIDSRGGRLTQGLEVAERLHRSAPASPHNHYLQAYIRRTLLLGAAGPDALVVERPHKEVAALVAGQFDKLLSAQPDYVGPREHTAETIRGTLAKLRTATKASERPAPAADEPEPPTPLTAGEIRGLVDLRGFQGATDSERKILCRDRRDEKKLGGPSIAERRADLACFTFLGDSATAMPILASLKTDKAPIDACAHFVQVTRTIPAGALAGRLAEWDAVLKSSGLDACVSATP